MTRAARTDVHFVEIGGQGGVFQHTLELAQLLGVRGTRVIVHTAVDAEHEPVHGAEFCRCMSWCRNIANGRLRRMVVALRYMFLTLPHLFRVSRTVRTFHVQGASPLCSVALLAVPRASRRIYSPHNTFSRAGSALELRLLKLAARRADVAVAFSNRDLRILQAWGCHAVQVPLVQFAPQCDPGLIASYRDKFSSNGNGPIVGFFGQVRPDKGGVQFVEVVAALPDAVGVVVGKDLGGLSEIRDVARTLGQTLEVVEGYLPLDEFACAMSAVDIVIAPYEQASQSGVLALARALSVPTVSSEVGGLTELATASVAIGTTGAYVGAIREVLNSPRAHDPGPDVGQLLSIYFAS